MGSPRFPLLRPLLQRTDQEVEGEGAQAQEQSVLAHRQTVEGAFLPTNAVAKQKVENGDAFSVQSTVAWRHSVGAELLPLLVHAAGGLGDGVHCRVPDPPAHCFPHREAGEDFQFHFVLVHCLGH